MDRWAIPVPVVANNLSLQDEGRSMKPNINDLSTLTELKRVLADKNVSSATIATLEKTLTKGMSFKGVEDLALFNITPVDLALVGDSVEFGLPAVVGRNVNTVEYRFAPVGDAEAFFGYQLIVRTVTRSGFTVDEAYPIEDDDVVIVDYDVASLTPDRPITLYVNTATGSRAEIKFHGTETAGEFLELEVSNLANALIDVRVAPREQAANPAVHAAYPVRGKLILNKVDAKLDGYQIVLFAATGNLPDGTTADFMPVASARTETNGYFVTSPLLFTNPLDMTRVTAAKASIVKPGFTSEVPIRLTVTSPDDHTGTPGRSMIPERVILVISEAAAAGAPGNDPSCGCNLNFHDKKVLEEFSYYTVVRTSEPSIIADVLEDEKDVDLRDIYGVPRVVPFSVFRKLHAIESRQIDVANFALPASSRAAGTAAPVLLRTAAAADDIAAGMIPAAGAVTATAVQGKRVPFSEDLLDRLIVEHRANAVARGSAKVAFKGRTHLNQMVHIDWDETPTIYQAASIAHGHLLHFKQEWMPDGYTIGDLVYSLPLAPGQKKQIAVLDWERRESAANSQSLDYEETLSNSLVRDRDISDVVSGTLTENIRGNSKASTAGIGFGLGSSVMGIIPGVGTFGSLLGISGGASTSGSTASQRATRSSTASSLQMISDRTQQAASVVRSQRASVVQTVTQGERVEATAESIANYNHCHAITIQYFEVLRHFAVRNRLAGVQECLFIPLPMTPYDLDKCLRWRTSLERHLFRRELLPAFDAVERIQNERQSPYDNYYDSIGFPRRNFAEQAITSLTGELFFEFFFFNTSEQKVDQAIVTFFSFFGISLDGYRDKQITDQELANHVGPRAIEYLLDAFRIETDKGVDLKLDLTLISRFRQNTPLRVAVRQSAGTPATVARDQIAAVNIKLDLSKIADDQARESLRQFQNKYMKVRLRSGTLRYTTNNFAGVLLDGRIENDVFAGSDGAYVPTPLNREELRNPRGEDVSLANNLIHHLNENLEHYDKCLMLGLTPERRYMLLDGILAPGKAHGRSVASVVENRVIGVAGNSLIMPVAPGYQLDPTIDKTFDLFAQYHHDEPDPMRISLPTRGVYAEAVMGQCNSCEKKDETRFWRWEESPIPDSPSTQILPLNTDTRRADPGNLQAKDFPNPVVNIQNAPNLPDPTALPGLLQNLGNANAFRDLTGLNQNQLNALATYQKALETAGEFGKEAAELAKTMATVQMAKDAQKSGSLSNDDANQVIVEQLKKSNPDENREQAKKDIQVVNDEEEKGHLDQDQGREMREDVIRKQQGTTKPTPKPSSKPASGKRKYNLKITIQDFKARAFEGTWLLNYGSLRDVTFETNTGSHEQNYSVEVGPSDSLTLRGNPGLVGLSFPPGAEYYYHYIKMSPTLSADRYMEITFGQTFVTNTVEHAETMSDQEIKMKAVAEESGTQREYSAESGSIEELLLGKVHAQITFFGRDTTTTTDGTTHAEGSTRTVSSSVRLLSRRLAYRQKGVVPWDIPVEDK